jgi:hypothetical protein
VIAMTDYKPGERVDVTIRGARVVEMHGHDLRVAVGDPGEAYLTIGADALRDSAVTVERVTPAEWPPRLDDLWRDHGGVLWFRGRAINSGDPLMGNSLGEVVTPDQLLTMSPVLVFRHDVTPSTPAGPRTWDRGDTIPGDVVAVRDADSDVWRLAGDAWYLADGGLKRYTDDLLSNYGPVTEVEALAVGGSDD